MSIKNISKDG